MTERYHEFMFGVPWVMSFFHQDWRHDAPTPAGVVAHQFVDELYPASVLSVRRDAQHLVDQLAPGRIETLWTSCSEERNLFPGCVTDGAVWMRQIIAECDTWLARRGDEPVLPEADRYDGLELLDPVLREIAEFTGLLGEEVSEALTECARRCTPDLAFRLLLPALRESCLYGPQRPFELSSAQFGRLKRLGSAFHYGEFVVSEYEYLVYEG
ncbi:hypothetical protein ABII15_26455 [Streptomyces sp. HUAS MG91]|uniref:Uncharacterized protein n=1 Tax=Streptomyces tabacisoli TaxID=3156398 RepID=A0AAU8IXV9_9ACTN